MSTPFDFKTAQVQKAKHDEGFAVVIKAPDGGPYTAPDGTEMTVQVAGMLSRKVRRQQQKNAMAWAGKENEGMTDEAKQELVLDAVESGNVEVAVAATIGWSGVTADGVAVPCTPENARTLYVAAPAILDQVLRAMRSRDADFRTAGPALVGASKARRPVGAVKQGRKKQPKPS